MSSAIVRTAASRLSACIHRSWANPFVGIARQSQQSTSNPLPAIEISSPETDRTRPNQ